MKKLLIAATFSLFSLSITHADEKSLASLLKQNYPELKAEVLGKTPIAGIYEVLVNDNLTYADESGRYFFIGNLVDYSNKLSLTQQRMQTINSIDVKTLPLKQAIKQVKGKGQRVLYIFTDPDCPYCKQLEQTLTQVDNITLYIFPFPITSLHPNAANIAKQIWCSKHPYQAWQNYLLHNLQPIASGSCQNPVEANVALGKQLKIDGTPTLFLKNGHRLSGAPSAEQLEELLNSAQ
jgi:thiol:disulfide interchange protein DsbC